MMLAVTRRWTPRSAVLIVSIFFLGSTAASISASTTSTAPPPKEELDITGGDMPAVPCTDCQAKGNLHVISFFITLTMMLGLLIYGFTRIKARKAMMRRGWSVRGPFYLMIVAFFFVMAEPTRHVLNDSGMWPGGSQYRPYCPTKSFRCLSVVGWVVTIFCSYLGFITLFAAVLWDVDILRDIKEKWRELRS